MGPRLREGAGPIQMETTVLDWFRNHWQPMPDYSTAMDHVEKLLGCDAYGFPSLFVAISEGNLPPPRSVKTPF